MHAGYNRATGAMVALRSLTECQLSGLIKIHPVWKHDRAENYEAGRNNEATDAEVNCATHRVSFEIFFAAN